MKCLICDEIIDAEADEYCEHDGEFYHQDCWDAFDEYDFDDAKLDDPRRGQAAAINRQRGFTLTDCVIWLGAFLLGFVMGRGTVGALAKFLGN